MLARYLFLLLLLSAFPAASQVLYMVEPLDIRPVYEDYAPTLVDSNLVIASIRQRAQAIAYTAAGSDLPWADLYLVPLRSGKPGTPRLMDGTLCTPFNDGKRPSRPVAIPSASPGTFRWAAVPPIIWGSSSP